MNALAAKAAKGVKPVKAVRAVKAVKVAKPPKAGAPQRVQLKRSAGWKMPANTLKVDRTTRWGNPFHAVTPADRPAAVARYRRWIFQAGQKSLRTEAKRCLRGAQLACWCPLDGPCHADILLRIANA